MKLATMSSLFEVLLKSSKVFSQFVHFTMVCINHYLLLLLINTIIYLLFIYHLFLVAHDLLDIQENEIGKIRHGPRKYFSKYINGLVSQKTSDNNSTFSMAQN